MHKAQHILCHMLVAWKIFDSNIFVPYGLRAHVNRNNDESKFITNQIMNVSNVLLQITHLLIANSSKHKHCSTRVSDHISCSHTCFCIMATISSRSISAKTRKILCDNEYHVTKEEKNVLFPDAER